MKSSEEILFEKIQKEKEEIKRLKELNQINFLKQKSLSIKNFCNIPTKINNENISSNENITYTELLKKKRLILKKDSNINHTNYSKNIHGLKRTISYSNVENNQTPIRNKTPSLINLTNNNFELDIDYLSNNLEKSCKIRDKNNKKKNSNESKSPVRFYFEQNNTMNDHLNNIVSNNALSKYNRDNLSASKSRSKSKSKLTDKSINLSTSGANSIRKMFSDKYSNVENSKFSNEEYKSNPIGFKSVAFAKKIPQTLNINYGLKINNPKNNNSNIDTFDSVIKQSLKEKLAIEKSEKEKIKLRKINLIKTEKFTSKGKENFQNNNVLYINNSNINKNTYLGNKNEFIQNYSQNNSNNHY